jgi:hypothetical protein
VKTKLVWTPDRADPSCLHSDPDGYRIRIAHNDRGSKLCALFWRAADSSELHGIGLTTSINGAKRLAETHAKRSAP